MHPEIFTDDTKKVWNKISAFEKIKDNFYLAGGTALALHIGHRISVDLDFFSSEPIKKTLLADIEEFFDRPVLVEIKNKNELTVMINGVKVTFLYYPFPLVDSLKKIDYGINLASIKEIVLMKAYALGRRQSLKDYVDLYTVISNNICDIKFIIEGCQKKYGEVFNDRVFLEQLVYIEDIEDEPIRWIGEAVSKENIRSFFEIKTNEYLKTI